MECKKKKKKISKAEKGLAICHVSIIIKIEIEVQRK